MNDYKYEENNFDLSEYNKNYNIIKFDDYSGANVGRLCNKFTCRNDEGIFYILERYNKENKMNDVWFFDKDFDINEAEYFIDEKDKENGILNRIYRINIEDDESIINNVKYRKLLDFVEDNYEKIFQNRIFINGEFHECKNYGNLHDAVKGYNKIKGKKAKYKDVSDKCKKMLEVKKLKYSDYKSCDRKEFLKFLNEIRKDILVEKDMGNYNNSLLLKYIIKNNKVYLVKIMNDFASHRKGIDVFEIKCKDFNRESTVKFLNDFENKAIRKMECYKHKTLKKNDNKLKKYYLISILLEEKNRGDKTVVVIKDEFKDKYVLNRVTADKNGNIKIDLWYFKENFNKVSALSFIKQYDRNNSSNTH